MDRRELLHISYRCNCLSIGTLFIGTIISRPDYHISVIELESDISAIDLQNGAVIHPFILPMQTSSFVREEIHVHGYFLLLSLC